MSEGAVELLEACSDLSLHSPEAMNEIGDFGWREVVTEHCLDIHQRFLVGGQGNRLQIGRFRLGAIRERLEGGKSLIQSAAKFSDCYLPVITGCL